eukprot:scaffold15721_cov232-Skeletonema_marinoi.AAC.1
MMKLMENPERVLSLRGSSRRGQLIPAALQSEKKKRTKRRVLLVVFPIVRLGAKTKAEEEAQEMPATPQ